MSNRGPIVLVEDDEDDVGIIKEIIKELKLSNEIVWFVKTNEALKYLLQTPEQPFIILSDVNLPGQSGVEFKRQIDNDDCLRRKSIPFIFYSTSADTHTVNEVYTQMTVQGYFRKSNSYDAIKQDIRLIVDYWKACKHPNI